VARRSRQNENGPDEQTGLPLVALVGRPNVGKSSLFNRLVGGRPALVQDLPGVTRDRRYGLCTWGRARFRVVDTGGLDPSAGGILGAMRAQTLRAVQEGTALVFVMDGAEGVTAVDEEVARQIRRTGKPVFVAVNKVDSSTRDAAVAEVYRLGWGAVFPVSATHGRGISDLLEAVVQALGPSARAPDAGAGEEIFEEQEEQRAAPSTESQPIRIAFVGKPNVGKSSLVNRLLGEERVLVHHEPGTTRDPIDTPFRFGDQDFVLVDTAGLRRRRSIDTMTEAVAAKMARDQLARADVAALVIDLQNGATAEDARLASLIEESGRSTLIVLNKNDLVARRELDARVLAARETLAFVSHAPVLLTSAYTGRGVLELPALARRVFEQWSRRVPTAELNAHFEELVTRRPPPSGPGGRHVRLYYITQAGVCPPTFYISANLPAAVPYPYRRYLANQIRQIYGFEGTPIRIVLRAHRRKKEPARAR
jgi:GTPase